MEKSKFVIYDMDSSTISHDMTTRYAAYIKARDKRDEINSEMRNARTIEEAMYHGWRLIEASLMVGIAKGRL